MNVWAISDLHLSLARPERRDQYAARWRDHAARIEAAWRDAVRTDDLVLLPGDLSMARNHRDLQPDLNWLDRLPGVKVLSPGNHDHWWNDVDKIRPMLRKSLRAVDGDAVSVNGVVVAGARAAPLVKDQDAATAAESAEIDRAFQSAKAALEAAATLRNDPRGPLYFLWHYPPFDPFGRPGPWIELFEEHNVATCVYGHLHTEDQWSRAVQGLRGKVHYHCVAADAVGFRPLRINSTN
jgi:predicted phosphohydrolase